MGKIELTKRREYNQRYYTKHKERVKHLAWLSYMKMTYGLSETDFFALLHEQGDACAICKIAANDHPTRLHVDHCHETGVVRGLLCQKCNRGLGLFNDNTTHLRSAIEYLDNAA